MSDFLNNLLAQPEGKTLEFKQDGSSSKPFLKTLVAFANTAGGRLIFGVTDDRQIVGVEAPLDEEERLCSLIADSIAPPFYPHEFIQRQSSLGLVDPSAMLMEQITVDQLDPLQRLRLRNAIKKYGGEQSLFSLADEELDGALGLVMDHQGRKCATVAGLLILGSETLLRQHLPAYEVAFQVLRGTDVRVNEFYRKPLLETFDEVELQFKPWVVEEEIQVGLFRVPVPNHDRRAFREAFVNALVHRDFSTLGAVHIKLDDDGLSISSPGGFIEGVNLNNLLVAPPRSRNPLLADIIKRIGLAERTGRGIDRIYEGMLRYGRPTPDYSLSNAYTVSLFLSNASADLDFLKMVVEQEDKLGTMSIDSLIILSRLREERRLTTTDLAPSVQKPEANVRATLEKLVETGFLEPHGTGRGRSYILSARMYQKAGQRAEYIRQAGFDSIQQEQMVLKFIKTHGTIKRADVIELCRLTKDQSAKLLTQLAHENKIQKHGDRRGTYYDFNP